MERQQQIEQLRRKIAGLVREIVLLAGSRIAPDTFFREFLARVTSAMGAVAGAVWYVGAEGRLKLAAGAGLERINFARYLKEGDAKAAPGEGARVREAPEEGKEPPPADAAREALEKFVRGVVTAVLKQGKPALLGPATTEPDGEGSAVPLLLTPIMVEGRPAGVVLAAPRSGTDPRALRGMLSFMQEVCRQAAVYLQQQRLRAMASRQQESEKVVALLEQAHASLDPVRVAFALVNMGQTMVGCDRLSLVVLTRAGKGRVTAVSGHDVVHRRSVLLKRQGALARRVCAWGKVLRHPAPEGAGEVPDRVAGALQAYQRVTRMGSLVVMPLEHEGEVLGALVAESKEPGALAGEQVARLTVVARHGAPALANALRYHRLPLLRALALVRGGLVRLLGRRLSRAALRIAMLAAPILALVFVPWELTVRAPVTVRPEVLRTAFAQAEGVIREVRVREGQRVSAGEELARIDDRSLAAQLEAHKAQLAVEEAKLLALTDSDDPGAAEVQRHVVAYHRARVDYYRRELEKTRVLSPIDGVVLTRHPEDLLEKPVKPGEALFRVARLEGRWILEIDLPEKEAGHVLAARERGEPLTATFYMSAYPQRRFRSVVREVAPQAEIVGQRNVLRLKADLPPEARALVKTQMGGEARVHCGRRSLGYVLFRGVIDFVRTHLTF